MDLSDKTGVEPSEVVVFPVDSVDELQAMKGCAVRLKLEAINGSKPFHGVVVISDINKLGDSYQFLRQNENGDLVTHDIAEGHLRFVEGMLVQKPGSSIRTSTYKMGSHERLRTLLEEEGIYRA